jgi:3'(2'), 5'-bisphosphate nucleotidase
VDVPFREVLPETRLALRAISEATKRVVAIYHGEFSESTKADESPVTIADLESHKIINSVLSESGTAIVSEEGEHHDGGSRSTFWLVDPLDGTREFVDRNGEFTIMIALVQDGKPAVGLISHPLASAVYLAQQGKGAFRLKDGVWEKLHVSDVMTLGESTAVISRSHVSEDELEFMHTLGLRRHSKLGSSLKALRICSGEAEIYFAANSKIKQWDTCASFGLVTESGGMMTDMFGGEITYRMGALAHERGVVISNGRVHDEFIRRSDSFRKKRFGSS